MARKLCDGHALVCFLHEAFPGCDGKRRAEYALHPLAVIIAEPYAGGEIGRIADKPRIAEILAGAGLACGGPAERGALSGPVRHGATPHRIHHAEPAVVGYVRANAV